MDGGELGAALRVELAAQVGTLEVSGAIGGGGVETEDFAAGDLGQCWGEGGGFKAAVHGVAGLGVAALKVEQVGGFLADAGAG